MAKTSATYLPRFLANDRLVEAPRAVRAMAQRIPAAANLPASFTADVGIRIDEVFKNQESLAVLPLGWCPIGPLCRAALAACVFKLVFLLIAPVPVGLVRWFPATAPTATFILCDHLAIVSAIVRDRGMVWALRLCWCSGVRRTCARAFQPRMVNVRYDVVARCNHVEVIGTVWALAQESLETCRRSEVCRGQACLVRAHLCLALRCHGLSSRYKVTTFKPALFCELPHALMNKATHFHDFLFTVVMSWSVLGRSVLGRRQIDIDRIL